ncbi:MAG: permease [Candidatus Omnitrophica bacterium]|nr:permease [Candidatus Omnitrophota bacterium]
MLRWLVNTIMYDGLGMNPESHLIRSLNFFIYDTIKILLLLFCMITIIGYLRSFLPQDKIKSWLKGKRLRGHFAASLFGALTPFCSCSSIPIFLSFLRAGIPLGLTFSFLITSPLINEYLVVLMLGFFGWEITVLYIFSGLFIGVGAGLVIGQMKFEKYIVEDMLVPVDEEQATNDSALTHRDRFKFGLNEAVSIVRKLWLWIIVGVGLGAIIHNYVPQSAIQSISDKTGYFSVPLVTLIGVPLYGSCAAIIPIAVALFNKGIPLGTALSFMMAIAALSLPEAVMLRRAMKLPLILVFFGVTTLGIIIIGYLFNFWQVFISI